MRPQPGVEMPLEDIAAIPLFADFTAELTMVAFAGFASGHDLFGRSPEILRAGTPDNSPGLPVRRRFSILLILSLCTVCAASAQMQWSKWYFGHGAALDFSGGAPQWLTGSAMRTIEGSASIADEVTGELYFYTNGVYVWNREHRAMPNGYGLLGHQSTTQTALIIPDPGDAARFYIFTADAYEDMLLSDMRYDGVRYSIVDMTLDGGRGDVVVKNVRLGPALASEKLCGIRRCDDNTYWVIVHGADDSTFHAYHVTATGIAAPIRSIAGSLHRSRSRAPGRTSDLPGAMKGSPDGARIAVVQGGRAPEIFDFDQRTGRITLALSMSGTDFHQYGVSFSPDGSRLYALQNVAGGRLIQYDLEAGDAAAVSASRFVLAQYSEPGGALQLGSDGRLYVAVDARPTLDVIVSPNALGAACGLASGAVRLGAAWLGAGLPNVVENELGLASRADAGRDTTICPGDSVQLTARGGVAYRWTPDVSLSCRDCSDPVARPERTTAYVVEAIGASTCSSRDTIVVTVHDASSVDAGAPATICAGDTTTLAARGGVRWVWSPSAGLSCAECPAPRASPDRSTTYTVIAFSEGGCVALDSVRVTVNDRPRVAARGDTTVCAGSTVPLHASGAVSYRWEPAEGLSCSDCAEPIALATEDRTYHVVGTSAEGCIASDSVRILVARTETIVAWIDTNHRAAVGSLVVIPIRVSDADAISKESAIDVSLSFDESILRLERLVSRSTITEGGNVAVVAESAGDHRLRLRAGGTRQNDTLINLVFRTFLAGTVVSPIELTLRPASPCVTIVASAGRIRLDSLCGLGIRLMEVADPLGLRASGPNPFDASTSIDFSIATATHVRMRVLDAAGVEVLRLLDEPRGPGRHTIALDGALLPRGTFLVVLEADGAVVSERIVRR